MNRIVLFCVNTNIFVSISTFSLYKVSELLLGFQNHEMGLFVFFSTLFAYNYMRVPLLSYTKHSSNRVIWLQNNKKFIYFLLFISGFCTIWLAVILGLKFLKLLILPVLISLIYPLLIRINNKEYGLRKIPFVKIFLISFTWSYVTLLLPSLYYDFHVDYFLISSFFQRFLFVIVISIPFDIRDLYYDHIKTIPNTVGVYRSKLFAWFCLFLIDMLLIINIINHNITVPVFIGFFLFFELCSVVIYFTNNDQSSFFYSILVEGLSIVMYLFLLIALIF